MNPTPENKHSVALDPNRAFRVRRAQARTLPQREVVKVQGRAQPPFHPSKRISAHIRQSRPDDGLGFSHFLGKSLPKIMICSLLARRARCPPNALRQRRGREVQDTEVQDIGQGFVSRASCLVNSRPP